VAFAAIGSKDLSRYYPFSPELVVEATTVCDRHCAGCYAPNTLSKADPALLYREKTELFIAPDQLQKALTHFQQLQGIAIRGGEPSLHPELPRLIELCHERSSRVYLETHGRWIQQVSPEFANTSLADRLAVTCLQLGTTIKISFDGMHELGAKALREMTDRLDARSVNWVIAITESDQSSFEATRKLCDWISDEQIIYQPKAKSSVNLFRPDRGVIRVDGRHFDRLQTVARFDQAAPIEASP
jgi:organic radical activating enzyme